MTQKVQNYSNHRRLVPAYHFFTLGLILALFISGIVLLFNCHHMLLGGYVVAFSVAVGLAGALARSFALKAQDRGIRAEENLRHFMLAGKPLSSALRLGQIIALRFASDEEFLDLAIRAEKENMKSNEIKLAIKNWRADTHRV